MSAQKRQAGAPQEQDGSGAAARDLMETPTYWTAEAMRREGSRFFQHLGAALMSADAGNRRRLYLAWPDECRDFAERGRRLAREEEDGDGIGKDGTGGGGVAGA